jgi:ribosomal protein L37AE/L43A
MDESNLAERIVAYLKTRTFRPGVCMDCKDSTEVYETAQGDFVCAHCGIDRMGLREQRMVDRQRAAKFLRENAPPGDTARNNEEGRMYR